MQKESLHNAAAVLDETLMKAWEWISNALKRHHRLSEYEVQQWILEEIHRHECTTGGDSPICAFGPSSAEPHYVASPSESRYIEEGDIVLIDLWCKQRKSDSVYADMTYVAVAASKPSTKQNEIFHLVRKAQKQASDFVLSSHKNGIEILGCEVDDVARQIIKDAGYEEFFIHRTGHNIFTELHGSGTHLDNLETCDERALWPNTCFSIEPGIYLPGEFGIRLEYDVLLEDLGRGQIIGRIQEEVIALL